MLHICVRCDLKVTLKKEEKEEVQKDVEMALLTFRNIDNYSVVIEEVNMKEMTEILKFNQEYYNLTQLTYYFAWVFCYTDFTTTKALMKLAQMNCILREKQEGKSKICQSVWTGRIKKRK
ncbi:uncharacterized protein MONOS_16954 [Monocercomonoides exilis]|uniref:uncharacterized protein n=1 Tax=Monocercomonoides exilis TaxID=2049356 RepID=UPI00355A6F8B|nr:hypothetical protein MONOS_16954 [Monocercomonoides exilis]